MSARKCAPTEFCSLRGNLAEEIFKERRGRSRRGARTEAKSQRGRESLLELSWNAESSEKKGLDRLGKAEATSAWDLLADLKCSLKSNKNGLGARDPLSPFQR